MVRKPAPAQRREWLRIIAFLLGFAVLVAHVFTTRPLLGPVGMWEVSLRDLGYHAAAVGVFTLAYRLSFYGNPPGSGRATILVCSGWAGFCEILQHWIPARDFSIVEFGVNVLTPVAVTGIVAFILGRRN